MNNDWRLKYERMKVEKVGEMWKLTVLSTDKQRVLGELYHYRDDYVRYFQAPDYRTVRGMNQKKLGTIMLWNLWIEKKKSNSKTKAETND